MTTQEDTARELAEALSNDDIRALIRQKHSITECAATRDAIEFAQEEIVSIVRVALAKYEASKGAGGEPRTVTAHEMAAGDLYSAASCGLSTLDGLGTPEGGRVQFIRGVLKKHAQYAPKFGEQPPDPSPAAPLSDGELREILAQEYEKESAAPGRHIRDGLLSVLVRTDVALAAMRRISPPRHVEVDEAMVERAATALCRNDAGGRPWSDYLSDARVALTAALSIPESDA